MGPLCEGVHWLFHKLIGERCRVSHLTCRVWGEHCEHTSGLRAGLTL
jgi:hypothetical protein